MSAIVQNSNQASREIERGERAARQPGEVGTFDPVLTLAVRGADPLLVQGPAATTEDRAQVFEEASLASGSEGLDALTPSQQAVLKMMASPPRSQDPLGVMARVESDLSGAESVKQPNENDAQGLDPRQKPVDRGDDARNWRVNVPETSGTSSDGGSSSIGKVELDARRVGVDGSILANRGGIDKVNAAAGRQSQQRVSANATPVINLAGGQSGIMPVGVQPTTSVSNPTEGPRTGTVSIVAVGGVAASGKSSARGDAGVGEMGKQTAALGEDAVEAEKVQAQALRGLAAALRKKGDAVTVVLRPEGLGKLRIDLRFEGDVVRGKLTCSTQSAQQLLGESVDSLARAMESRGLAVDRLEVIHDPHLDPGSDARSDAERDGDRKAIALSGFGAAGEQFNSGHQSGAGGTGEGGRGGAEFSRFDDDSDFVEQVDVLVHDPAFHWDGRRLALNTVA